MKHIETRMAVLVSENVSEKCDVTQRRLQCEAVSMLCWLCYGNRCMLRSVSPTHRFTPVLPIPQFQKFKSQIYS